MTPRVPGSFARMTSAWRVTGPGSITSETRASITIRQKGGLEQTLLHDDVLSTTVSPISLMPEGIEASTTMQGMADLLAYLRGEG